MARHYDNLSSSFSYQNCHLNLMLMPSPSTGSKMFWARQKIEFHFVAFQKKIVMAQKLNLLNANHLLVWHKKFGLSEDLHQLQSKLESP